ncbi:MAG: hypothetical protein Q9157_002274 [Trypethelium eluteriae]
MAQNGGLSLQSDGFQNTLHSIQNAEAGIAGTSKTSSEQATDPSIGISPQDGYPALAEYLGSDDRLMVFRRFSRLQARLILEKQDQIRLLEEEIDQCDDDDKLKDSLQRENPSRLQTRYRYNAEEAEHRSKLFQRAEREFLEYAPEKLLSAAHRLTTLERPIPYEYKNIFNYINTAKPVTRPEAAYIEDHVDLVTLRGSGIQARTGCFIELALNLIKRATRIRENAVTMQAWARENAKSKRVAGIFITIVMFLIVPLLFVVPIYALYRVGNNIGGSIGILVASSLTFTGLLLVTTSAQQHEVLSSSAAWVIISFPRRIISQLMSLTLGKGI